VIDEHGELAQSRRIVNDREAFLELLGGLEGESAVATSRETKLPRSLSGTLPSSDSGYDGRS